MKKVLLGLVSASLLVVPAISLAIDAPTIVESEEDLIAKIETIGNAIFGILLAVAAVFLIVAGFMFVTAGGNTESVTKARKMLVNALIGVAIALAAKGMVEVIRTVLGGE